MILHSSLDKSHPLRKLFPSNPNFVPSREPSETSIWISSKGSYYPLQFSVADQFVAQAHGSSEVYLLSPEHTPLARPFAKSHLLHRHARLNLFEPNDIEGDISGIRVTLNAGDVVRLLRIPVNSLVGAFLPFKTALCSCKMVSLRESNLPDVNLVRIAVRVSWRAQVQSRLQRENPARTMVGGRGHTCRIQTLHPVCILLRNPNNIEPNPT